MIFRPVSGGRTVPSRKQERHQHLKGAISEEPIEFILKDFPGTRYYPKFHLTTWHPMGIFDKAKDVLGDHVDRVDEGVDKAADYADEKTGNDKAHRRTVTTQP